VINVIKSLRNEAIQKGEAHLKAIGVTANDHDSACKDSTPTLDSLARSAALGWGCKWKA